MYSKVDAAGNVVKDFGLIDIGGTPTLFFPCFSSSGDCSASSNEADSTVLSFQSFVVGTIVKYPGGGSSTPNFGGTISYSGPINIPVPAPASLVLFGLAALLHRRLQAGPIQVRHRLCPRAGWLASSW